MSTLQSQLRKWWGNKQKDTPHGFTGYELIWAHVKTSGHKIFVLSSITYSTTILLILQQTAELVNETHFGPILKSIHTSSIKY